MSHLGPSPEPITVVLVDDHTIFRSGLRELLEEHGIAVAAEAPTAAAGVSLIERYAPDVAIVDLNLPDGSGIELIRRMVERGTRAAMLVLTISEDEQDLVDAVLAGGRGYVLKDAPVDTIVTAVRAVAAGESMLSPRMATMAVMRMRAHGRQARSGAELGLSPREEDVLRLVSAGKDNATIAAELFISPHTVKNHISSILAKLQVDNRIQAAVRAVRDELL